MSSPPQPTTLKRSPSVRRRRFLAWNQRDGPAPRRKAEQTLKNEMPSATPTPPSNPYSLPFAKKIPFRIDSTAMRKNRRDAVKSLEAEGLAGREHVLLPEVKEFLPRLMEGFLARPQLGRRLYVRVCE